MAGGLDDHFAERRRRRLVRWLVAGLAVALFLVAPVALLMQPDPVSVVGTGRSPLTAIVPPLPPAAGEVVPGRFRCPTAPAEDEVPGGAWPLRAGAVAVRACPGRGTFPTLTAEVTVPLTQDLEGLVQVVNALEPQPENTACTFEGGAGYVLAFQYADGSVQSVAGQLYGCRYVGVGGRQLVGADSVWEAYTDRLLALDHGDAPGRVDCWPGGDSQFPAPLLAAGDELTDALLCVDAPGLHRSIPLSAADVARLVPDDLMAGGPCEVSGLRITVAARSPWGAVSVPVGCDREREPSLQGYIDAALPTPVPAVGPATDAALLPETWRALTLLGDSVYAESLWVDPERRPDPWSTDCVDPRLSHADVPGWAWAVAASCEERWVMVRQEVTDPWQLLDVEDRRDACRYRPSAAPATLPAEPIRVRICALDSSGKDWIAPQDVVSQGVRDVAGVVATLEPREADSICAGGAPGFDLVVTLADGQVLSYRNDGECNEVQTSDGPVLGADQVLEAFLAAVERQRLGDRPESIERAVLSCHEGYDRLGRRSSLVGDPGDLVRAISCWRPNDAEPPPWRQSRRLTRAEVRLITDDLSRRTTKQEGYDDTCGGDPSYWQDLVGQTRWGDVVTLRGVCRTFLVEGRTPETYWHPSREAQALLDSLR